MAISSDLHRRRVCHPGGLQHQTTHDTKCGYSLWGPRHYLLRADQRDLRGNRLVEDANLIRSTPAIVPWNPPLVGNLSPSFFARPCRGLSLSFYWRSMFIIDHHLECCRGVAPATARRDPILVDKTKACEPGDSCVVDHSPAFPGSFLFPFSPPIPHH